MSVIPKYTGKLTLEDEIKELERELSTRQRVYPGWVDSLHPKLTKDDASKRIALLQKTIERLKKLQGSGQQQLFNYEK